MKTSTLVNPTHTKQNHPVRLFGRLLLKLLAVVATFGATCASVMIPHFSLLNAGIEGPLYWIILIPSIAIALAIVMIVSACLDGLSSVRTDGVKITGRIHTDD